MFRILLMAEFVNEKPCDVNQEENSAVTLKTSDQMIESMEASPSSNRAVEIRDSVEEVFVESCRCKKKRKRCKKRKQCLETENNSESDHCDFSYTKDKYMRENFDAFGKSVGAHLKFLPLRRAVVVQEKIQSFLNEEMRLNLKNVNLCNT